MNRDRYADLIGAWGPNYGYGGPAIAAFGQGGDGAVVVAPDGTPMGPGPMGPPVGFPGGPWGPWGGWPGFCGGPPAQFSPLFEPKRSPAVALGPACGPLALRKVIGFDCDCIDACSSKTFHVTPQEVFKGDRLVISRAVASSVVIRQFSIGVESALSSCGGCLPGDAFVADAETGMLNLNTAWPGVEICLTVENITDQPIKFSAALFGSVLSGGGMHLFGTADP